MKAIARSIPTSRKVVCCCRIIVQLGLDRSTLRAVLKRREHRFESRFRDNERIFTTREPGNNSIHGRGQTLMPLTEAFYSNRTVAMSDHPQINFSLQKWSRRTLNPIKHAHTSLTTAENLSKSSSTILAWDHVRDHAHFHHDVFFRALDQVASHTAVKGVVAALETAPEASQAL